MNIVIDSFLNKWNSIEDKGISSIATAIQGMSFGLVNLDLGSTNFTKKVSISSNY